MQKHNFHTHTTFSDGWNTIDEMVDQAVNLGFTSLGLSDHSHVSTARYRTMEEHTLGNYVSSVRRCAKKYAYIRLYAGIEQDAESCLPEAEPDYVIASVHEMVRHGVDLPVDSNADFQRQIVRDMFGGSFLEFAKAYYDRAVENVMRNKTDIIGHFDLVTKFSLAPEDDENYIRCAVSAAHEAVKHCRLFELNTGAIARGYRAVPYPAEYILREIKISGGEIIVTSDCHKKELLTCWFAEAEELLTRIGFEKYVGNINEKVTEIELWR